MVGDQSVGRGACKPWRSRGDFGRASDFSKEAPVLLVGPSARSARASCRSRRFFYPGREFHQPRDLRQTDGCPLGGDFWPPGRREFSRAAASYAALRGLLLSRSFYRAMGAEEKMEPLERWQALRPFSNPDFYFPVFCGVLQGRAKLVALWITDDDGSAAQHPLCSFRVVFGSEKIEFTSRL